MGIIRVLLALSVVLGHLDSGIQLVTPSTAVQAFYIISGFYMSLILNEKYVSANGSYKLFITNRLLRIYPVYYIVLALVLIFSGIHYITSGGNVDTTLTYYFTYYKSMGAVSLIFLICTNIVVFFQDAVMFMGLDKHSGTLFFTKNYGESVPSLFHFLFLPQAWSIGLELMFYLIAPFIVKRNIKVIAVLIILSLGLRAVLMIHGLSKDPWNYRFFPTELVFFLLGTVSYAIYRNIKDKLLNKWIPIAAFGFIIVFSLVYSAIPGGIQHYIYLMLFFILLPFIFYGTKKWKADIHIGELSYPIYLSHLFVAAEVKYLLKGMSGNVLILIIIAGTIILSYLLNKFVAKRVERYRQKRVLSIANVNLLSS